MTYCRAKRYDQFLSKYVNSGLLSWIIADDLMCLFMQAEHVYEMVNHMYHYHRLRFFEFDYITRKMLMALGRPTLARQFPWRWPYYEANMLWEDMCFVDDQLSGRAILVQSLARRWLARRHVAALKIQSKCHRWLWEPRTRDGKLGINMRLLLKDFGDDQESKIGVSGGSDLQSV